MVDKYMVNEDRTPKDTFVQYCIANELAKANALKEIELELLVKESDYTDINKDNLIKRIRNAAN